MKKHRVRRHEVVQPLDTSYRYIPLTQNKVSTVDAEDFEYLMQWNWHVQRSRRVDYAVAQVNKKQTKMHQLLCPEGKDIPDHIDGDGLNNRKSNLRRATIAQNCANSGIDNLNTSGFKGVSKVGSRWKAKIACAGVEYYLGLSKTPEEAARVYDEAARRLHGEFAYLNFPIS